METTYEHPIRRPDCDFCGAVNCAMSSLFRGEIWNHHACADCTSTLKRQLRGLIIHKAPIFSGPGKPPEPGSRNPFIGLPKQPHYETLPAWALTTTRRWQDVEDFDNYLDDLEFDWMRTE